MAATWVLVAHRAGARIFENDGRGTGLSLVRELSNEEARLKDIELESDKHGRTFDRFGPGRHAVERQESHHERAAANFARTLAGALDEGRTAGSFAQIVLVAEPRFLGMLRAALSDPTAKQIKTELRKDLAGVSEHELPKHIDGLIPL